MLLCSLFSSVLLGIALPYIIPKVTQQIEEPEIWMPLCTTLLLSEAISRIGVGIIVIQVCIPSFLLGAGVQGCVNDEAWAICMRSWRRRAQVQTKQADGEASSEAAQVSAADADDNASASEPGTPIKVTSVWDTKESHSTRSRPHRQRGREPNKGKGEGKAELGEGKGKGEGEGRHRSENDGKENNGKGKGRASPPNSQNGKELSLGSKEKATTRLAGIRKLLDEEVGKGSG